MKKQLLAIHTPHKWQCKRVCKECIDCVGICKRAKECTYRIPKSDIEIPIKER